MRGYYFCSPYVLQIMEISFDLPTLGCYDIYVKLYGSETLMLNIREKEIVKMFDMNC